MSSECAPISEQENLPVRDEQGIVHLTRTTTKGG
jgi:hypothetical protein